MVSLVDIYNVKESTFSELKKDRNPAKGNKAKDREKDFYFIDEPQDPETGQIRSKVVYKHSFSNMVKDLEVETIDMKKISEENPDDVILYNISEDLQDIFNKFRTHVRKNYPNEYKKLKEEDLEEANVTGTGALFTAGNSMAYIGKNSFKKKRK